MACNGLSLSYLFAFNFPDAPKELENKKEKKKKTLTKISPFYLFIFFLCSSVNFSAGDDDINIVRSCKIIYLAFYDL